ncbi:hypothetical protein KKH23_09660 [Patescibacteria group bacterium]|nr:hypothetical protein [Patescibacteria group bacterium]
MTENTQDFSKFGYRELAMAGELLTKYSDNPNVIDGNGIHIEFNPNSGNVFIVDEDFNVAMMNGDVLEQWFNCPYCGHEGFLEEMDHEPQNNECTRYLKEIGVIKEEEEEEEGS